MEDLSEEHIREHCPHCNILSQAFTTLLDQTDNFYILCDAHPLREGHILIMPKQHISCVGEYSAELITEFKKIYREVSDFVRETYGTVSTFEHGKIGQTVFHSHIHILPFGGESTEIIPEGASRIKEIESLDDLVSIFRQEGQYLFFSIESKLWVVDTDLGEPRFFRDRFAAALGQPARGNWKSMHVDPNLMAIASQENVRCKEKWEKYINP